MRAMALTKRRTGFAAAILALVLAATAAEARPAYIGKWATTAAQCRLPPSSENAPIVMTRWTFDQYETHCDLRNIAGGRNLWTAKARCVSSGNITQTRVTLYATAMGLSLKWREAHVADNNVRCR